MAHVQVELFRNVASGHVWAANPGTAAYRRMRKGVAAEEFERVQPDRSRGRKATSADQSGKQE